MTPHASLVLVSFRSSQVLPGAVESFRTEARRAGFGAEVVVVDHSEDPAEHAALAGARPDVLMARPNRGYAAGVNAGVAAARGSVVLVGNPDLVFQDGSLAALLAALHQGWDVVGPQFTIGRFLLPPADEQTPRDELRRWLASRSRFWWERQLLREIGRWARVWGAGAPIAQAALSGALIACRRGVLDRIGPWDESYFLYFEENDWLRRARRAGYRVALQAAARVTHFWAHSATPARYLDHFVRSRNLFYRRSWPARGRVLTALTAGAFESAAPPLPADPPRMGAENVLWLVSPVARGYPAAGLPGDAEPPIAAIAELARLRGGIARYTVFAVEPAANRVLGSWTWDSHG